jgi:protein-disulfide isomerase
MKSGTIDDQPTRHGNPGCHHCCVRRYRRLWRTQVWEARHRPPAPRVTVGAPPAATHAKVESVDYEARWADASPATHGPVPNVVIVEFSDFQCPFCGRYARETFASVKTQLLDKGKARYLFRNFPLEGIHPFSLKASKAAVCARRQGRFDDMHTALFAHQTELDDGHLRARVAEMKLDARAYATCMATEAESEVRRELAQGQALEVTGTPTFFIGTIGSAGHVRLVKRVNGAPTLETLEQVVAEITR